MKYCSNYIIGLFLCPLFFVHGLRAQPIQLKWQQVAAGVWKVKIGETQPIDLLRAGGGSPRVEALKNLGERPFPLPEGDCYAEKQQGKIYLRFPLEREDRLFGLGLNFKTMNQRGRVLQLHMDHYGGEDNGRTHAPVPFYVSDKGYGVLVNSAEYITVYAGTGVRVDTKHPPRVYDRNTEAGWEAQPFSDAVEIQVPATGTEVYVFAGNDALEAVQRYNLFSGGGTLPPKWGLGFTQRMPSLATDKDVRKEVEAFEQHQFPLDFIGLEPGWQTKSYPCTFEWEKSRFPDAAAFTKEMLEKGIRLNLWLNPYISPSSSMYEGMKSLSGDHTVWNGLAPDPNMPAGMAMMRSLFMKEHLGIGISGYKIDEIDGFDNWLWPDVTKFPSGLSGSQMRQVFAPEMQRRTFEWFRERNQRTYGLARGTNAGGASLPYVLYDDYYNHRDYITALCNSGFIGVLWSPEVRSSVSAEEWLRRIQSVCFSPMAMINAWADGTKPWSYPEVAEQVKQAALLRMQLFPYLYTCFAQYLFEGKPPVRPMNLVPGFSYNPAMQHDVKDQFMLGDYLLVAPMFTGEKTRKVILPAGRWYDFYTGELVGDGSVIEIMPGLDRIPLYVKDGGIIPMISSVQHAPRPGETHPMEIRFYGETPGSSRLYDDDGTTFNYEKGDYAWYPLRVSRDERGRWEGHTGGRVGNFSQQQYSGFTWKFMTKTAGDKADKTAAAGDGISGAKVSGDTTYLYVAVGAVGPGDGSIRHPFSSLEEARQAIRELREKFGGRLAGHGVTVRLRAGIYELSKGFQLDTVDSGTEDAPIVFTAFPGERVILSGGRRVAVGKAVSLSGEAAQRIISKPAVGKIREIDLGRLGFTDYGVHKVTGFRRPYINAAMELFINGQPYHLARYPDTNMILLDTGDVVDKGLSAKSSYPGKIRFDKAKLAQWAGAEDVMVSGNFKYAWATDQLRVASMDAKTGVVSFADAHPFGIVGGKEWNQYYFFNIMAEIDQPGEYYIDARRGKLYFYPLAPLRASDTIVVSMLEDALVSMKGASHVRWEHIDLEAGRGMGFYLENTVSDRIAHCTIRNMGVIGVCIGKGGKNERQHRLPDPFNPVVPDEGLSGRLGSLHELLYENTTFNREGGKDNGVIDCRIENTGCGGISIGGGDRVSLEPAGNYVYNSVFTQCGRIDYSYRSPVNIDGVGNRVQHCLFNACPATAIYLHGNDHLIEYNEIREACNFIDDQGAIYMGRDPSEFGNVIRWNFFRDIGHLGMTMAVYFDDGACGSSLYGNVFYKAGTRTIMVGGGSYNHIFNNIFIDSKMAFHLDNRLAGWSKKSLEPGGLFEHRLQKVNITKPPYSIAYPGLARYFEDGPETPQHNDIENNVLVNVGEVNNGKKEWGPVHDDNFITTGDPGFVDLGGMDLRLKENSMVFEKLPGFKAIPFGEMGLLKGGEGTAKEMGLMKEGEGKRKETGWKAKDTSWRRLSLRQKIGQMMMMLPDRELELKLGGGSLKTFFARYPVTGFFMGWKLWDGVKMENRVEHIKKKCVEYQGASGLPLLFQEDYESGVGIQGMTAFPNEMSLGAAHSPALAYDYGRAVALESRSVGVKWVLHPVADINLNPLNPITNTRSIGDDPDEAIRLLSRQIRGLQDNGVAATIKHFPGDGVDSRDQHLLTSCNSLAFDVWKEKHGKVFQALIDSGVACIMPGHITLPSYQREKINGFYPPATLSKELLTGLLKGEMGFKGVVVSDAMVMGGFRGYFDDVLEGQVQSFLAGVDVLLWPSYAFMDTVESRIRRGEIPMARLDDAVQRVWALKERFGLLEKNRALITPVSAAEKARATMTSDAICERAVTLVRDREHSLPLNVQKDRRILVVGVAPIGRKGGSVQVEGIKLFAQALRNRGFKVDFRHNILYETQGWKDEATEKYDRIIFVVARSTHAPFGPLQLWDDEAQSVWAANAMPKKKIIVVAFGSPYLVNEYFERVNTCINAYSNTPAMHRAVVKALLGETKMSGVSPVDAGDETDTLSRLRECRSRQGLPNFFKKLKTGGNVTIAWLGGSITQAGNGYREQATAWLEKAYPGARITALNAGVGGTGSDLADFRLGRQVLAYHPDMVFVEFAVNDKNTDTAKIHETMEGIVRQIWKQDGRTDICFVYTMTAEMYPELAKGTLPAAARAMEDIAEYYHIPSIDMCLEVVALASAGKLVFKGRQNEYPGKMVFSADEVHPYPETGHRLYTEAIARSLRQMDGEAEKLAVVGGRGKVDDPGKVDDYGMLIHNAGRPMTRNRYEQAQMLGADQLEMSGQWVRVEHEKSGAGVLTPGTFPVLLKSGEAGASLTVRFNGTMVGLYDVIGPGSGKWEVVLDGKLAKSYTRFDRFATYWRPNYLVLGDLAEGEHTVTFRVSGEVLDKRALLGGSVADLDSNAGKYRESACYAGYLLLAGRTTGEGKRLTGERKIKVACIGNSITYGYGVPDREKNSYPGQLQALLGDKYEVTNFGVNGATLLSGGDIPYRETAQYRRALESRPDVVFMKLGTNDSKLVNRVHLDEFVRDYKEMVRSFRELSSHPRIVLLLPVPSYSPDTAQIWDPVLSGRIIPLIQQVAYEENLEVINLYALLTDKAAFYTDKVHPGVPGLAIIAKRLYELMGQQRDTVYDIFGRIDPAKKISSFYGYPCADFIFEGRNSKIVKPRWAAVGHPWVWRARFWGHEPQADIALLERGFHVVYCDVAELFGNSEAVGLWNDYYALLKKAGLSEKAALEGMSRGGVYVYNWAAVNPGKVACIYADNPVLDLKSWPGGKGKGPGSKADWEVFKKDYGYHSEEEAMSFAGSPMDKVKEIVRGGYPMLHVCGDADEVVPMEENSLLFEQKVKALGGAITLIHKPNGRHHPHSLKDPTAIVDFIVGAVGR